MKFSPRLGFNARITCNLVSKGFPLFDIKRYLFCHSFSSFTSNFWCGKTACSKWKKNQFRCAIFRILIYSNPKILQISFLKPFLASVIKFFSSYKKFRRAVFKRLSCNSKIFWLFFHIYLKQLPLIPRSILLGNINNINTLVFLFPLFISIKHVVYTHQRNLHKQQSLFIGSMIISAILQYFLKCC